MANVTISQIANEVTSPAADDWIEIEENSTGMSGKIKKSNLLGALLTGGGTLATGGFTLTVPATGTGALRDVANTFTALQTFSSGVNLGDEDLDTYDRGSWTPTENNITFDSSSGNFVRIGRLVHIVIDVTWPTTADSNNIGIRGVPFAPSSVSALSIGFCDESQPNYCSVETTGSGTIRLRDSAQSALTNADMTGARIILAGSYRSAA